MKNTHVEWAHHTFNPWIGCTKKSPGCLHCYAETLMDTRYGRVKWGAGQARSRTSEKNWKEPLDWHRKAAALGIRQRVFSASLADWLDEEVPIEWLADLLELIHATPSLDWLLPTKRPENWKARLGGAVDVLGERKSPAFVFADCWLSAEDNELEFLPRNVWVGVTVEDQARATERIPLLIAIPAKVRFLSCEPLLEKVELLLIDERSSWVCPQCGSRAVIENNFDRKHGLWWECKTCNAKDYGAPDWKSNIHWVIAGGESGPSSRPMHVDWARSLRDQCQAAAVPFFFKQWGDWIPGGQEFEKFSKPRESEGHVWEDHSSSWRVGKLHAGRLLDGVIHDQFPASSNYQDSQGLSHA